MNLYLAPYMLSLLFPLFSLDVSTKLTWNVIQTFEVCATMPVSLCSGPTSINGSFCFWNREWCLAVSGWHSLCCPESVTSPWQRHPCAPAPAELCSQEGYCTLPSWWGRFGLLFLSKSRPTICPLFFFTSFLPRDVVCGDLSEKNVMFVVALTEFWCINIKLLPPVFACLPVILMVIL